MGILRVLGPNGDTKVEWDLDVEETVREAERILKQNVLKGYVAFRVDEGIGTAQRIDEFDPQAKQILQVPRIMGG